MAAAYVRTYGFTHACTCPRAFELRPRRKIAHVVPVRRAIVAGCASCPVCASCTRRRAHPTYVYVRTYARISVCTQVRTYVRSSQRRVLCARCARSRQYVRYVRAHVRSSHSRVMCASCARSRKCVRTYVRTSQIRAMNVRTYVRTYASCHSRARSRTLHARTYVRTCARTYVRTHAKQPLWFKQGGA